MDQQAVTDRQASTDRHIGFRVVTQIDRPDPALVERLARFRSVDLSDGMNRAQTMVGIRPAYVPIKMAAGPAVTVSIPASGINMVKMGMEQCRAGDVLVVSVQGDCTYAMWGGNVSRGVQARGVRGFVIDGAIRDVSEIRALDFPVFSRGIATAAGTLDSPRGEVNVPIACGGVVVNPGDIVVADEDGIVVIPPAAAQAVLEKTEQLVELYASIQPVLLRGEVTSIAAITKQLIDAGLGTDKGGMDVE